MGKKRKSIATSLDEVDRSMHASFCSAANSLSQLYTQGMNNQKLSFQAGERHALDKIYQWIRSTQQGGSRVTTDNVLSYLQNELGYCGDEATQAICRRVLPVQYQHTHTNVQFTNSAFPPSFNDSSMDIHDSPSQY
ncbi:uncharacterized protein LOC133744336 [Rosa rugosa]|uniref:uncharacterized protein LOC133744336 n=1 Tax=Rosa rugosa TaxID=74645 RepID=UPI002B40DCF5|nr:uncharacterized protein LOC133744336 [Rosa rugosa]